MRGQGLFSCPFCFGGGDEMDALTFYKLARGYKHINAFAATVQSAHETGNGQNSFIRNNHKLLKGDNKQKNANSDRTKHRPDTPHSKRYMERYTSLQLP